MAAVAIDDAGSQLPLSLYLELEPGTSADLEVVSRAALAWASAIREVVYNIDPSLDIRIELTSGTEGSLSLNSVVRTIKKALEEPVTFIAISILVGGWFLQHVGDKVFDIAWEDVFGKPEQHVELSAAQMDELAAKMARAMEGHVGAPQFQQVYRELERDPAIKGVGVTSVPKTRPKVIVPRADFATRAGRHDSMVSQETIHQRSLTSKLHVVLISPVLLPGERRWRLRGPTGEFGATIKDKDFIERTLTGATAVPMVTGIDMEIVLEVKEEMRGGVWTIIDRSVLHVLNVSRPPITGDLFSPFPEEKRPSDRSNEDDSADDI